MPIETDPLSLLFLASFLFGLLFLIVTSVLGNFGHGHGVHHVGHGAGQHVHLSGQTASSTHQTGHYVNRVHVGTGSQSSASMRNNQAAVAHLPGTTQGGASLLTFINPTTIILFLLGFGFFGYVFHSVIGWILPLTLLGAIVGGLAVTLFLLALLVRIFGNSEGQTIQDVSERIGLIGKVSLTIQANSPGEIIYLSPGGMRKSLPARSVTGQRIERDQEVVVVNYQHGTAEVDTWEHFMEEQDHQDSFSPSTVSSNTDSDELAKLRSLIEDSERSDAPVVMRNDLQKE